MSETYEIYTPNNWLLDVDKKTNKIYFADDGIGVGKYTERYSKALLESWKIMESSPYKSYKPMILDSNIKPDKTSNYLEYKKWRDMYLKDPPKGVIAPWTNKEKAYYQSLKTKRERYKYLVIRSGLRSSVIDIPFDAYCGVDENGKLINKKYESLYKEVERNRGNAHISDGYLAMGEWELAAGILGDIEGFYNASYPGFTSRSRQIRFLALQLGAGGETWSGYNMPIIFKSYVDGYTYYANGIHKDKLRATMLTKIIKTLKPDNYGMLPYLDELIGVDWVMDFNDYEVQEDSRGSLMRYLYDKIEQGKLKDPRDKDSTKESREEFLKDAYGTLNNNSINYNCDLSNDMSEEGVKYHINNLILEAKLKAITPPQGYPNAPTYYIPEHLDMIYKDNKLDKLLNPTIPAIYRYNFPEYLRNEIEAYAKKHNIK